MTTRIKNVNLPGVVKIKIGDNTEGEPILEELALDEMSESSIILALLEGIGRMARDKTLATAEKTLAGRRAYIQKNVKRGEYNAGRGRTVDTMLEALKAICMDEGKKKTDIAKWTRIEIGQFFAEQGLDLKEEMDRIRAEQRRREERKRKMLETVDVSVLDNETESDEPLDIEDFDLQRTSVKDVKIALKKHLDDGGTITEAAEAFLVEDDDEESE